LKKILVSLVLICVLLCGSVFAFAGADPSVTIVSPSNESTIYSDNFLISVKMTKAGTYTISLYEEMERLDDGTQVPLSVETLADIDAQSLVNAAVGEPETFVSINSMSFYTKQVNHVTPGVYRIKVESLNSAGQTEYTTNSYFIVKDKEAKPAAVNLETPQPGFLKSIQSFLKNIFN